MEIKTISTISLVMIILHSLIIIVVSAEPPPPPRAAQHFVLVHGGTLGAWSWYKIIALLKSDGHNVTAIDLASSGIDPRPASSVRSISEFHQPLIDLMESLDDHNRIVLVGHSLGGLAISRAMEMFPSKIHVAVFIAALMPGPTLNTTALEAARQNGPLLDSRFTFDNGSNNPPTTIVLGPQYISSIMFDLCSPEDKELAKTLVRPMPLFSAQNTARELVLTKENYGSVKRVFILTENDLVSKTQVQRFMIKQNPPNEVKGIRNSGHMAMISKPKVLWALLKGITINFN